MIIKMFCPFIELLFWQTYKKCIMDLDKLNYLGTLVWHQRRFGTVTTAPKNAAWYKKWSKVTLK